MQAHPQQQQHMMRQPTHPMLQQQPHQLWTMNTSHNMVPYQNNNGNMNGNGMSMGGNNAGPFFWRSVADTCTCSNINNCVTQNLPRLIPTPPTSRPVPPDFVPLHRTYLSYNLQCQYSTCGKPIYVAPPSKKVQFKLPPLHKDGYVYNCIFCVCAIFVFYFRHI